MDCITEELEQNPYCPDLCRALERAEERVEQTLMHKQTLYRTAFHIDSQEYVSIISAHLVDGTWWFYCRSMDGMYDYYVESDLTRFVL